PRRGSRTTARAATCGPVLRPQPEPARPRRDRSPSSWAPDCPGAGSSRAADRKGEERCQLAAIDAKQVVDHAWSEATCRRVRKAETLSHEVESIRQPPGTESGAAIAAVSECGQPTRERNDEKQDRGAGAVLALQERGRRHRLACDLADRRQ